MPELSIGPASLAQIELLLDWAAREGWNPGIDDALLFQAADPDGFFMAFDGERAVAGISVIRHDERHGFLGLYICHPDYRGKGCGWALWQAGMGFLEGMVVGLDGVVEQQDNYRKSGFEFAYRNIRYAGSSAVLSAESAQVSSQIRSVECRSCTAADFSSLLAMDARVHGYARQALLASWLADSESRLSLVCVDGESIRGFGTIRQCEHGFKVGPLIADTADHARALLQQLIEHSRAQDIILDVPEPNGAARVLAESAGLVPVFETARMFHGSFPEYQLDTLFGVASFELG